MEWTENDFRELAQLLLVEYGDQGHVWPLAPIDVLILTILSQATSDGNRDRAFLELKQRFASWEDVENAYELEVIQAIASGGLARMKGPRIQGILRHLSQTRGNYSLDFIKELSQGQAMEYLEALPGMGPKSAACVLLFAFARPTFPVDTHVRRIVGRLGILPSKTSASKMQSHLQKLIPQELVHNLHMHLIDHGRKICQARTAQCDDCILVSKCQMGNRQSPQG